MGHQQISQTERLARWICKALKPGAEIETGEVHRLVTELQCRQGHISRTWRQQVQREAEDVPEAVQLALSRGWLADREGRLCVTESGAEMARHSRSRPRKKRLGF
jgi:hypothetical protein